MSSRSRWRFCSPSPRTSRSSWLCEAELWLEGFAGLRRCFELGATLVARDFEALHSIDGDGLEDKVSPLAGLNGVGGEGTLIQPLRLSPLVPGGAFFRHTLWDFQMAQRPGEGERLKALRDAVTDAGPAAMRAHFDEVKGCIAAFSILGNPPPSSPSRLSSEGTVSPPSTNQRSQYIERMLVDASMSTRPQVVLCHRRTAVPGVVRTVADAVIPLARSDESIADIVRKVAVRRRGQNQSPGRVRRVGM